MRVNKQDYDFAGWVTKNDVKCSDGRTIRQNAFAHMDGKTVPLVYNHNHSDIENVLGNVLLENRKEGVYGYAKTNGTGRGTAAKECVQHGDIVSFSIYANHLKETNTGDVMHGDIKEVSLVLAGANEEALIDTFFEHGVDGEEGMLFEEEIKLDKNIKHSIEIIVDRIVVRDDNENLRRRLTDSIESALQLADGLLLVDVIDGQELSFSQNFACPDCGISVAEIEPRSFSFNNPFGACPDCLGLGYKMEFDDELMIPDRSLSINDGCIVVMGWQSANKDSSFSNAVLRALAKEYKFSLDTPFQDLPQKVQDMLIHGSDKTVMVHYKGQRGEGDYPIQFDGLIKNVEQRYKETFSDTMKAEYEEYMRITPCALCGGQRLKKESLAVTIDDKNIYEITSMSIEELQNYLENMKLTEHQEMIGAQVLKEIRARVGFLVDVGLDYLSLSRATSTLSGGEAQRIRLATQIGSGLCGVCYILDEPSIGLHQRDTSS